MKTPEIVLDAFATMVEQRWEQITEYDKEFAAPRAEEA